MAKNNLHEKLLEALEMQLHSMKDNIVEVQAELIAEGYTTHPIFIAHRGETDLGQPYLDREEYNLFYDLNISTIEELTEIGILEEDKNDEFRKAYGKTNENTCILCVFSEEAQFVFFPLANQKTDT
jgi:hypothetical protein